MSGSLPILLLSGSTREVSCTRVLAETIEAHLGALGAETFHWDLRERPLPIADPNYHHDPSCHPDPAVRDLVHLAAGASGFVLASPIYHNSYSGVLKNALDHLSIGQVQLKPVGLASHGGHRSPQAVDHLRIVVRGLLGLAIPTQVCTSGEDFCEGRPGAPLSNQGILQRIDRFALELVALAGATGPLRQGR
jgi:azobenzene reductase